MRFPALAAAALCGAAAFALQAQVPEWSIEAQSRLLRGPGANIERDTAERQRLAREGEWQLAQGDAEAAQLAFDRAAQIVHSADIEVGLVRAYMQAGQYRRALAFAAHAAGAHRDVAGGAALYAWLLHIGGQSVYARRLLDDALERAPGVPVLVQARALVTSPEPRLAGALMELPLRAAPYAWPAGAAAAASVVGTAVLAGGGDVAVVPVAIVAGTRRIWVRNGMGQTVAVRGEPRVGVDGLAWLALESALPLPPAVHPAPRDPFAGSPAYSVEYAPSRDGAAAWPVLYQGFAGRWLAAPDAQLLGLDMPRGPRGGPVFDAQGRLAGVAMPGFDGRDRMVSVKWLSPPGSAPWTPSPDNTHTPRTSVDQVYEASLRLALQVLVDR